MKISLTNAGKRFNREWIFRNLSFEFTEGNAYAITGPNGSGKSTLLQVIGGSMVVSEGKVNYEVPEDQFFRHMSITAPYLELIEEMTAQEFLSFHAQFKPLIASNEAILEKVGLAKSAHKQVRYYSSGMKQRLKLAQAIFSNVPCVLLDEPCTNLDADGIALYQGLIAEYGGSRMIIVSSNDVQEYSFCKKQLNILDFK
jgi:ABC-type multidrug transport system ATPase subunit